MGVLTTGATADSSSGGTTVAASVLSPPDSLAPLPIFSALQRQQEPHLTVCCTCSLCYVCLHCPYTSCMGILSTAKDGTEFECFSSCPSLARWGGAEGGRALWSALLLTSHPHSTGSVWIGAFPWQVQPHGVSPHLMNMLLPLTHTPSASHTLYPCLMVLLPPPL